jgi:hypothetical protein
MNTTQTTVTGRDATPDSEARAEIGVTGRSLAELLDELGCSIDAAIGTRRRRRLAPHQARALAAVLLATVAGLTAFLVTRPPVAPSLRPIAAVKGLIARGTTAGVPWALAVNACPEPADGYTLSLLTADGSTTTGCAGVSRPASTIYDQARNVALVFGSAPGGTVRVQVAGSGGSQRAAAIARQGPLSTARAVADGAAFFVGVIPVAQTATAITDYGSGSRLIEACSEQRCVTP